MLCSSGGTELQKGNYGQEDGSSPFSHVAGGRPRELTLVLGMGFPGGLDEDEGVLCYVLFLCLIELWNVVCLAFLFFLRYDSEF